MAVLLSARELSHGYGAQPLFAGLGFTLEDGERVGLIGPNGAGKSTLLRILAGVVAPDRGDVARRSGVAIAYLAQVPELAPGRVRDVVKSGLWSPATASWEDEARVDEWISKLGLDASADVATLSGGSRKRAALARALVGQPELLLLDEPTNHLDIESILWLERVLTASPFATLTVTHDRWFLQRVSNRILELDPRNVSGLLSVRGDYATYLERKAEVMDAQEQRERTLANTLRRETEWLLRGAKARTTKQEARIRRAGALEDEVAALKVHNRTGSVELEFRAREAHDARPRRLIEARAVSMHFGERSVFEQLDVFVSATTRLGLLGPNGCGKSTLLRVLTGEATPTSGEVIRADGLRVAYFEQNRADLRPERTLADTVCPEGDYVTFRGKPLHRHGYLERFLFRSEQMVQPVASLSGGEQSRLLIACLMLRPANVLVLDEPTNDLDLPTLGVLEEALTSFEGAVLLVTHDRYFLDRVANEILAFDSDGPERRPPTLLHGLEQWETWRSERSTLRAPSSQERSEAEPRPGKRKKLSFNEQREWDGIEARILEAEGELERLQAACEAPEVARDGARLSALHGEMVAARARIDELYGRWAELEALVS